MDHRLFDRLRGVKRRQVLMRAVRWGSVGLLSGAAVATVLALYGLVSQQTEPRWLGVFVMLAVPIISIIAALVSPLTWRMAATAIDESLGLKDRSLTALTFLEHGRENDFHHLQVDDALQHLSSVDARAVIPFRWPRSLTVAGSTLFLATILSLWPIQPAAIQASIQPPNPVFVEQSEILLENLEELKELAKESGDEELVATIDELEKDAETLKEEGIDQREALAKLSEIENALLAQQAKYNVGLVDAQLSSLGEAMSASKMLEGVGAALQAGDYEQAAKKLEEISPDAKMSQREAKATSEKMDQVAKGMAEAGLASLSQSVSEASEKLSEGGASACEACKGLSQCVSKHAQKKKLSDLLCSNCNKVGECKGNCKKNSLVRNRARKKSDSPSENYGMTASGNTDGEMTDLLARKNLVRVSGEMGDGSSETEMTHSPEGKQSASRSYREVYQQYQKMSEAVLDREPIPLGHRETIRKYFELIRPEGSQPEANSAPDR